jgi:hypothetical protein
MDERHIVSTRSLCKGHCFIHIHRLDSMGNAGFSYDFGATNGHMSGVGDAFNKFLDLGITLSTLFVLLLQPVFPFVTLLPTERRRRSVGVKEQCGIVAKRLLKETKEAEAKGNKADEKSVLGLLGASIFRCL